jgi:hypothetical protein
MGMCLVALAIILYFSSKRGKIVVTKHTPSVNNLLIFTNYLKSKALQMSFNPYKVFLFVIVVLNFFKGAHF